MSGLFNAISEAIAPATQNQTQSPTTSSANKPPVDSIHPVVPPTAQTSEFINAGSTSPQPNYATGPGFGSSPVFGGSSAGFGGGLASNPNVPRPGTSINPETGKPHTAGLTRAELQAIKDKGKDLLDDTPQSDVARRGSKDDVVSPDLSGREQAAAQLAAASAATGVHPTTAHLTSNTAVIPTGSSVPAAAPAPTTSTTSSLNPAHASSTLGGGPQTPGAMTPGLEMPGAWGPVRTAPVPGSSPDAPSSVYEDVASGLEKVGLAAYSIIPQSLKEVISPNVNTSAPTSPAQTKTTPRSPTLAPSSPNSARRASLLDQAKAQTSSLLTQAQQTVQQARKSSVAAQGEGFVKDVKGFFGDVVAHTPFVGEPVDSKPKSTTGVKTSLPSQEPLGAQPGDKTAGAGALPGKLSETGVAVLPDEKKQPVRENQSSLPGENSAFGSYSTSSGQAGPSGSSTRDVEPTSSTSGSHAVEALSPPPAASTIPEPAPHHTETSTIGAGSSTSNIGTGSSSSGDHSSHAVAALEPAPSASTIPEPAASRDLEPATTPSVDLLSMPATALALETLPEPTSSRNTESTSSKFVESLPETSSRDIDTTPSSKGNDITSSARDIDTPQTGSTGASEPTSSRFVESLPEAAPTNSFIDTSSFGNKVEPTTSYSQSTPSRDLETSSSTAAPSTFGSTHDSTSHSSSHGSYGGLAAPLPATFLGTGAAHGATDLETVRGISTESAHPADANGTGLNPSSTLTSSLDRQVSPTPPANDRTTSLASVTAIRHGHEGERSSSNLAKQALGASALASVAEGQRSTTRGTGPEHTTSLTPGNVEDGVGHPSSRSTDVEPTTTSATPKVGIAPTSTTNPEAKPAVKDEQQPTTNTHQSSGEHAKYPMEGHDQPKSNVFNTGKDTTGHEILKHDGVLAPESTVSDSASALSPTSSGHHAPGVKDEVAGHHRTGSTASTGADGKKKSGFLGKLKEKLHHH